MKNMKKMNLKLQRLWKWISRGLLILLLVVCVQSCSTPLDSNQRVKVDQIIANESMQIDADSVSISSDQKSEYGFDESTNQIQIQKSEWSKQEGFFNRFIVWPLSTFLNWMTSFAGAGTAMIFFGTLQEILFFLIGFKNRKNEWFKNKIQNDCKKKIQELENIPLYQRKEIFEKSVQHHMIKNHVRQSSNTFIKILPYILMFGMVYAVYRSAGIVSGTVFDTSLVSTPLQCIEQHQPFGIGVYFALIAVILITTLYPIFQLIYLQKKSGVKISDVDSISGMAKNAYRMAQVILGITIAATAFLYINWPIAMSIYWIIRSVENFAFQRISAHQEKRWEENLKANFDLLYDPNEVQRIEDEEITEIEETSIS